jgi:hypothetical protein
MNSICELTIQGGHCLRLLVLGPSGPQVPLHPHFWLAYSSASLMATAMWPSSDVLRAASARLKFGLGGIDARHFWGRLF